MFQSTEELMKFQFMSMSLGYFSSLNMLKNLREINSETTTAAIASSADTAAAAAAAAAAANIPSMKHLKLGASDMLDASQVRAVLLAQTTCRAVQHSAFCPPAPPHPRRHSLAYMHALSETSTTRGARPACTAAHTFRDLA